MSKMGMFINHDSHTLDNLLIPQRKIISYNNNLYTYNMQLYCAWNSDHISKYLPHACPYFYQH